MMTKYLVGGVGFAVAVALIAILVQSVSVSASAQAGFPANHYVATTTSIGPSATNDANLFASNPQCTGRAISTSGGEGEPIHFLTLDPLNTGNLSSTTLSVVNGLYQAASSSVYYDASEYGCGIWPATAAATTSVTVIEYQ